MICVRKEKIILFEIKELIRCIKFYLFLESLFTSFVQTNPKWVWGSAFLKEIWRYVLECFDV